VPPQDDDYQLVRRTGDGDENALSQLMERYRTPLFHFAYRYTGNYADAREIAEETFVKIYFAAAKFSPRGKVKTWIFTIAANLARDYLRRSRKHRNLRSLEQPIDSEGNASLTDVTPAPGPTSAEAAVRSEDLRAVEKAIAALPHKIRFPLVFCVLEGNSYEECARVLGSSVKTIDSRIYRARQRLRATLSHIRS